MTFNDPLWLLDSAPREVQLEALRRSYGGWRSRDRLQDVPHPQRLRDGPVRGWSHYLEPRLGKTPTTLNEFELFRQDYGIKRIISICPNTFKQGWVDEAKKSGSTVPWEVFDTTHSVLSDQLAKWSKGEFGLAVNYEALKSDKTKAFMNEHVDKYTMLAIDESVKIKDHTSLQTKEVLRIAKNAGVVRNLSGLPSVTGPHDLYPQFRAIGYYSGLNFFSYRNRFCKMGGFKAKKVVGAKNEEQLQEALENTGFIALRRDWAVPLQTEYVLENIQLSKEQQKHYDEMNNEMVTLINGDTEVSADMVVSKMLKLQQISSGFIHAEGKPIWLADPRKTSKMMKLLDLLEETNKKVIVTFKFKESGKALLTCLEKWNPALLGSAEWMKTNGRELEAEKRRFNNDSSCRVIIVQIVSGKYGHDLSGIDGDRCDTMVFYENTFSLDDRVQVEMRNTAAFQDWTNICHDFVCSPVEKVAVDALAKRKNMVDSIIDLYREKRDD